MVGIKGAIIAELFAIGPTSFMQLEFPGSILNDHIKELRRRGNVDSSTQDQLHVLRRLGNNARHANSPAFTPSDKPKVADAVCAIAALVERRLFPADTPAAARPAPASGGILGQVTAIKTALNIPTPANQMRTVVDEANTLLGLPDIGTIPEQTAELFIQLGLGPS